MLLDHLNSALIILAALLTAGLLACALYLTGVIPWVLGRFGALVRWGVTTGFRVWVALLSWADWRRAAALEGSLLSLGFVAQAMDWDLIAVPAGALLLGMGLVTCLAYMYLSFERYEVARGYKAVHNPLKGQELAADLALHGDRVGVLLLVVSAVGTLLGFVQLNHALYASFGHDWYALKDGSDGAGFADFLAYALLHLLRIVDVLDVAQNYGSPRFNVVRPVYWPASGILMAFKSFFTLVLLQQVFASVREGRLLAETVNDFWSPHAPIHDRARYALPQFGPTALPPILESLRSLGPLTKEQRDQLPHVFATIGPSAVPALLRHVDDPHETTRAVVARALGLLHATPAAAALVVLATDESEAVRAAAVEALGAVAESKAGGRPRSAELLPVRRTRWRTRFDWLRGLPAAGGLFALRRISRKRRAVLPADLLPAELEALCISTIRTALADTSPTVRGEAVAALGRIGPAAAAAVGELARILGDDGDEVRRRAAVALGQLRAEPALALPALTAALACPTPEVRGAAAAALGQYGEAAADAVPFLVALLQDRDDSVRSETAAAINRIGVVCETSTQLLVEGLESEDNVVRAQTAEALGVIGEMADGAAPSLVAALGDSNDAVRAKAAEALGKIGEGVAELAVPGLVRLLRDEDNWVRALAAEALGQMGEAAEDAAPALLRSLRHASPLVRANAAEALGRMKAEDTRAALEAACRDEDAVVRARAVQAVALLGPAVPSSTAAVLNALTDADPQVRAAAVDAVGNWPGVTVDSAVFLGLIDDGNDEVAARAIRLAPTLCSADAAVPALRGRLAGSASPLVQTAAAISLGRLGDAAREAFAELAAAAREGDADLRLAAMRALARVQPPEAAGVFAAGLRDPDAAIRMVASGGLMKVTAIPDDVIPVVVESLRDPDEQVRANAAHLLSLLDPVPPEAIPDLIACVAGTSDGLRLNAATALRRVADPAAAEALRSLLGDPNPRVRLVAAGSLAATAGDDLDVRAAVHAALNDTNPKIQAAAADLVASLGRTVDDFAPPVVVARLQMESLVDVGEGEG